MENGFITDSGVGHTKVLDVFFLKANIDQREILVVTKFYHICFGFRYEGYTQIGSIPLTFAPHLVALSRGVFL